MKNVKITKEVICKHPLVVFRSRRKQVCLLSYLLKQRKKEPYRYAISSDGETTTIRYEGARFGPEEYRKIKHFPLYKWGRGKKVILADPKLTHRYEDGWNIWQYPYKTDVYETEGMAPSLMYMISPKHYPDEDPRSFVLFELVGNIRTHHNVIEYGHPFWWVIERLKGYEERPGNDRIDPHLFGEADNNQ